jgi:hypothetical protein
MVSLHAILCYLLRRLYAMCRPLWTVWLRTAFYREKSTLLLDSSLSVRGGPLMHPRHKGPQTTAGKD